MLVALGSVLSGIWPSGIGPVVPSVSEMSSDMSMSESGMAPIAMEAVFTSSMGRVANLRVASLSVANLRVANLRVPRPVSLRSVPASESPPTGDASTVADSRGTLSSGMEARGTPEIPRESTVTLAASAVSVSLVMPKSLQGQCTLLRSLHQSVSV